MPSTEERGALGYLRDFFRQSRDVKGLSICSRPASRLNRGLGSRDLWGGAVVLHPELRALLRLVPLLIVALRWKGFRGPVCRAVDPNVQALPPA